MVRNVASSSCRELVPVRVEQTDTPFTAACASKQVLQLPIAHGEGNYYAEPDELAAARGRSPGRLPLRERWGEVSSETQSERLAQQHCRHLQRRPQRRRPDAASRARLGSRLGSADGRVVLESVVKALSSLTGLSTK